MSEILVRELREEHRDREWVELGTSHGDWYDHRKWCWMEDAWAVWDLLPDPNPETDPGRLVGCNLIPRYGYRVEPPEPRNGPFMEILHYQATRGRI